MNLIVLIINAYQNSESFYSNTFDYGIVLRDYVDLSCYFNRYLSINNWQNVHCMFKDFGLEHELGVVIKNCDLLFDTSFNERLFNNSLNGNSVYPLSIDERMRDSEAACINSTEVLQSAILKLAHPIRLSKLSNKHKNHSGVNLCFRDDGRQFVVDWVFSANEIDESALLQVQLFSSRLLSPCFYLSITFGLFDSKFKAYLSEGSRYFAGGAEKIKTKNELNVNIKEDEGLIHASIVINGSEFRHLENCFHDSSVVASAGLFQKKIGNIFWNVEPCSNVALGDVYLGRLGRLVNEGLTLNLVVNCNLIEIYFEDESFGCEFSEIFSGVVSGWFICNNVQKLQRLIVYGKSSLGYSLELNGEYIASELSKPKVSHLIMQYITDLNALCILEDQLICHSCMNIIDNGAILIMGESGLGKTSLSIALAEFCSFAGDESVFVNPASGCAFSDKMPFLIKDSNHDLLRKLNTTNGLAVEGGIHGKARYFNRELLNCVEDPEKPRPIRYIVFPEYVRCYNSEILRIESCDLVEMILKSVFGAKRQSNVFREFSSMVAKFDIELLKIRYGNVDSAAKLLYEYINRRSDISD
jgi:hypothetical protein